MDKISQLVKFLNHSSTITPEIIEKFLSRLKLSKDDLLPWIVTNRTSGESGKKMIHQAKNYEIMLVSWGKNEFSSIHYHEQVEWGVIQIFGIAKYAVFQIDDDFKVNRLNEQVLTNTDVIHINKGIIHQLGNNAVEPFFSLHVYGNNKSCDNISNLAKNYIIKKNKLIHSFDGIFI